MKKIFLSYYKNYDKVTMLSVYALLILSLITAITGFGFLTYLVIANLFELIAITFFNFVIFNYDVYKMFNDMSAQLEKFNLK